MCSFVDGLLLCRLCCCFACIVTLLCSTCQDRTSCVVTSSCGTCCCWIDPAALSVRVLMLCRVAWCALFQHCWWRPYAWIFVHDWRRASNPGHWKHSTWTHDPRYQSRYRKRRAGSIRIHHMSTTVCPLLRGNAAAVWYAHTWHHKLAGDHAGEATRRDTVRATVWANLRHGMQSILMVLILASTTIELPRRRSVRKFYTQLLSGSREDDAVQSFDNRFADCTGIHPCESYTSTST